MPERPDDATVPAVDLIEVRACPFCGSEGLATAFTAIRDRLRVSEGSWSYLRCPRCRSLVLSPRPRAEDLAGLYPAAYTAGSRAPGAKGLLASAVAATEAVFFALQYREQLVRVAGLAVTNGSRAPSLIDVGCGNGRRLMQFHQLGMRVAGADFRAETADEVRAAGIPVYECDIHHLDDVVPASSVDIVTAFYVLEHADDAAQMLRACRAVLRPGGWLAVAVPLAASCQEAWFGGRWSQLVEAPRHTALPSAGGMTTLLHTAGFAGVRETAESRALRAAMVALSLVPDGVAALVAGEPTARLFGRRALAGVALAPGMICALAETHLAPGPGAAVFLARRSAD